MSTSTTGLVGIPIIFTLLFFTAFSFKNSSYDANVFINVGNCDPSIMLLCCCDNPRIAKFAIRGFDSLVIQKVTTQSGLERSSWNQLAISNFFDSYGLGIGLGTARASSFIFAVISNVGVPGSALYILFFITTLGQISRQDLDRSSKIAARNGALGLLIPACIAGTLVDMGPLFFIFAGLACGGPTPKPSA